jgi:hypothetical protein
MRNSIADASATAAPAFRIEKVHETDAKAKARQHCSAILPHRDALQ